MGFSWGDADFATLWTVAAVATSQIAATVQEPSAAVTKSSLRETPEPDFGRREERPFWASPLENAILNSLTHAALMAGGRTRRRYRVPPEATERAGGEPSEFIPG